jgi:hypothetical protein
VCKLRAAGQQRHPSIVVPQHQDAVEEYIRADWPWAGDTQEDDLFTGIAGVL